MIKHINLSLVAITLLVACDQPSHDDVNNSTELITTPRAEQIAAESKKANDLYERLFEESVARSPETLTYLGRKERMGEWDDLSEENEVREHELIKQGLAELKLIDSTKLNPAAALSYELFKQSLEEQIEDYQWRLYNYPVNQMFGQHSKVASLLINQHRISNISDAEAYISRLNGVKKLFDQLVIGINRRADANIIPPKYVFPHVLRDSKNIITGAPFDGNKASTLLMDFTSKLDGLETNKNVVFSKEKKAELLKAANDALLNSVQPAYKKLIATLTDLEKKSTSDDGVWKWKNGNEFYNVQLKRTTTTELSSEEIHNIGLAEVKRIHDEMRAIKENVGFEGDLEKFMLFMRDDKQFYYDNDEEGKKRYLSEATALIDNMKTRLDELFIIKPKADLIVKAVESFREQSAGIAFYQQPSEDGIRPGTYYANLYDMSAMPTYAMEALAYHEGIPGHHMQIAIQQELKDIPKFRKFGVYYTAYVEGWGLYSEFLPKEIGLYSDPYSDFGRLSMELWRACRLVVDTGIHAKKWTREQAIKYYTDNTPNSESSAVKMVERHVVMPSQATAYKIGMMKILELREKSKVALKDKFDIRAFHDEVLKSGPLPLNVLERQIDAWVASQQ